MSQASPPHIVALIAEAQRMLSICNACRYCEGYCAVFPALERRLVFTEHDIHYLANLCHNCGACYYACQYAPPHEFALNFPRMLAQVRVETYSNYAWPSLLGAAFARNGLAVSLASLLCIALLLSLLTHFVPPAVLNAAHSDREGAFYAVMPHAVMAASFGIVALLVVLIFVMELLRFWPKTGERVGEFISPGAFARATSDVLRLRYLDGGGQGCTYPGEQPSAARRRFHHLTFYGFMLCFAATVVATIYHYIFGWRAPYPFWSVPVILGTLGGIGLLIGPAGLLWLRQTSDPELSDPAQSGMDIAFVLLLFLTSLSGLLLLAWRETPAMGMVLAVHLAFVLALFLTLPYGKFVHALYRYAALVRYHIERRQPLPEIGSE